MSAVIADPSMGAVPVKGGKKKLMVIVAIALVVVLAAAGGAVFYLKQKAAHAAAEAAADEEGGGAEHAAPTKVDPKNVPVYLALDPFVVNLADKEADRYAQIGITFELENGGSMEEMKAFMPSIRNAILMILANKTSRDLIDRAGKERLAEEIQREAVRPMGIDVPALEVAGTASAAAEGASGASSPAMKVALTEIPKVKPKVKRSSQKNPIQHVHFSSFIIQ